MGITLRLIGALAFGALALSPSAAAREVGWALKPADISHGEQLIYDSGERFSYKFECASDAVSITQTGVTELLDLKTNLKIGDGPDAVMPEGAALMALYGGKGTPDFMPATAIKNQNGGWDLTIRLAKDDKQLRAIGSSKMLSLFTTGYTAAIAIDDTTRTTWKGFLKRCQGGS